MVVEHKKVLHVIGTGRNVGKTMLLEFLADKLIQRGFRVGFLKHSLHEHELDKPGTDSYRLQKAGASPAVFYTPHGISIVIKDQNEDDYEKIISNVFRDCDLVLVESNRSAPGPKIVIADNETDVSDVVNVIAVVSSKLKQTGCPVFKANDETIIDFLIQELELNH